jgi:hypothetical protein
MLNSFCWAAFTTLILPHERAEKCIIRPPEKSHLFLKTVKLQDQGANIIYYGCFNVNYGAQLFREKKITE